MFKEVIDILNCGISDDPNHRPTSLEMEQMLNQVLIAPRDSDEFLTAAFHPDPPTPLCEDNPLMTVMVSGSEKNEAEL